MVLQQQGQKLLQYAQMHGKYSYRAEKENKTVVTITHDMEFAVNNFKKIFVMSHKNLLRVGNAKEIFSDDELLKDSMLKKTYIGDLCDRLNLNETAVTIEEFLKYFV